VGQKSMAPASQSETLPASPAGWSIDPPIPQTRPEMYGVKPFFEPWYIARRKQNPHFGKSGESFSTLVFISQ